jgi:hypothetical protein
MNLNKNHRLHRWFLFAVVLFSLLFLDNPSFFLNLRHRRFFLLKKGPPEQYHVPAALFTLTSFGRFHSMATSANHHTSYVTPMETNIPV